MTCMLCFFIGKLKALFFGCLLFNVNAALFELLATSAGTWAISFAVVLHFHFFKAAKLPGCSTPWTFLYFF